MIAAREAIADAEPLLLNGGFSMRGTRSRPRVYRVTLS